MFTAPATYVAFPVSWIVKVGSFYARHFNAAEIYLDGLTFSLDKLGEKSYPVRCNKSLTRTRPGEIAANLMARQYGPLTYFTAGQLTDGITFECRSRT